MKYIFLLIWAVTTSAFAEVKECNNVEIIEVLTGPQYDTMFKIDGISCIGTNYVCIHPKDGYMDAEVANSVKSNVLSAFVAGKTVQVRIEDTQTGCGGFPMVWLVRMVK